jgi:hypothetical protein
MFNAQQFRAKRIVPLTDMATRFNSARAFILQHHPDEQVGEFVSMEGLETMHHDDLEILKVRAGQIVTWAERRADEVREEVDEAERIRAESHRQQNMTEDQAWREKIERALAYQGAEIAKLKAAQLGRLPALPHVARSEVPQLLGMPRGLGRLADVSTPVASGGARRLGTGAAVSSSDAPAQSGFTRRQHPLDVIGSSGRQR